MARQRGEPRGRLLDALLVAAVTSPSSCPEGAIGEVTPAGDTACDEKALGVHADGAERALGITLDGLAEIVGAVPELDLRTEIPLLLELLDLASKLEVFRALLGDFHLEVDNHHEQVGGGVLHLRVMKLLRDLADVFRGRNHVVNDSHSDAAVGFELLKWVKNDTSLLDGVKDDLFSVAFELMSPPGLFFTHETVTPNP